MAEGRTSGPFFRMPHPQPATGLSSPPRRTEVQQLLQQELPRRHHGKRIVHQQGHAVLAARQTSPGQTGESCIRAQVEALRSRRQNFCDRLPDEAAETAAGHQVRRLLRDRPAKRHRGIVDLCGVTQIDNVHRPIALNHKPDVARHAGLEHVPHHLGTRGDVNVANQVDVRRVRRQGLDQLPARSDNVQILGSGVAQRPRQRTFQRLLVARYVEHIEIATRSAWIQQQLCEVSSDLPMFLKNLLRLR